MIKEVVVSKAAISKNSHRGVDCGEISSTFIPNKDDTKERGMKNVATVVRALCSRQVSKDFREGPAALAWLISGWNLTRYSPDGIRLFDCLAALVDGPNCSKSVDSLG